MIIDLTEMFSYLYANGLTYQEIASVFHISKQRVHQVLNGPTYIGNGMKAIRELVRIRDGHTCQKCFRHWKPGARRFDVHHMDADQEGRSHEKGVVARDKASMARMITLCHPCHMKVDSVRARISAGLHRVGKTSPLT
jgi:hypothetical protein